MAVNGRLPDSALAPIAGGRLAKPAALRWNAMNYARRRQGKSTILPNGPNSSYRTFAAQVRMKAMWTRLGKPENAATPGTSNHGLGLAVDVNDPAAVEASGASFGFQKRWSDAPWEPWHYKWAGFGSTSGGSYHSDPIERLKQKPLRRGSRNSDVLDVQVWLQRGGYISQRAKLARRIGTYGPSTEKAVRNFQAHVGLKADGIVNATTYAAIARRWSRIPRFNPKYRR